MINFNCLFSLYQDYKIKVIIKVKKITVPIIGEEITSRFGNDEEEWEKLDKTDSVTLKFLKAAHSFIPQAKEAGTDFKNAAFIFAQVGREFVIKAGNADWEFYFSEEDDGKIRGKCVRKGSWLRYVWDPIKETVISFGKTVLNAISSRAAKQIGE